MNMKELEAKVLAMEQALPDQIKSAVREAIGAMRGDLMTDLDGVKTTIEGLNTSIQDLRTMFEEHRASTVAALTEHGEVLAEIVPKVEARNKSAPEIRNMTDADARRVMDGDLKGESHRDAAEKIGLTYAQVYSCRLEYTFKHVHKELRDTVEGWKNPWAKKGR